MKKRILLINPPYPFEECPSPPNGLMAVAAYLLREGFDVRIEDYIVNRYTRERAEAVIGEYRPEVIGATGVTMNINRALAILADCREIAPEARTVMGGPHATFDAENILARNPFVDFIVRGEGELTFTELLNAPGGGDYSGIRGLSYRNGGAISHNGDRPLIPDINVLPPPARHLAQIGKYRALGLSVNMLTSRGCPHECTFCVGRKMVGSRVRYYDTVRVVDEFESLAKLGFRQINIADDLFTANKKRCVAICEMILERGIVQPWTAFARVDTVTRDLLAVMKKAGCTMLCFGVESGSQEVLDRAKKRITLGMCEKAVALCNETGIGAMTSYVIGLPGETPETLAATLEFSRNLGAACYGYHILAPFPGTEVRERSADYGLTILTDDWDRYDANHAVSETAHMPGREIERVFNDFNAGIERYIQGLRSRYENRESLSASDRATARNIQAAEFTAEIMTGNVIESFKSANGADGSSVIGLLVDHVAERSRFSRETVAEELGRLFNEKSLGLVENGGAVSVLWM